MLRLLVRKIDLNQHTRAIGGLACGSIHTLKQVKTVDRLDPRERRGRAPGFVRLQVADQVPLEIEIGECVNFRQCFLDAILTE